MATALIVRYRGRPGASKPDKGSDPILSDGGAAAYSGTKIHGDHDVLGIRSSGAISLPDSNVMRPRLLVGWGLAKVKAKHEFLRKMA